MNEIIMTKIQVKIFMETLNMAEFEMVKPTMNK
jgi:hypothetical protein